MALDYTEETFDTRTVEVYELDEGEFILRDLLTSWDERIIEAAVDGDGIEDTDMPNGRHTVYEYYSNLTATEEELTERYFRERAVLRTTDVLAELHASSGGEPVDLTEIEGDIDALQGDVSNLQNTVSDHEDRISNLENEDENP